MRFQADYELGRGFQARVGIALYQKGDLIPFDSIAKNDRFFGQLVYAF